MKTSNTLQLLLATAVAAFLLPAPISAQDASSWTPWIGCWEPIDESEEADASEFLVCLTPDGDGVAVETLVDGEVVDMERLVADGAPHPIADEGCEGTRRLEWSADGRRLYLTSRLLCGPGVEQETRGVFAIGYGGFEWVDIQAVSSVTGEEPFLSVRRFQPASRATLSLHDRTDPTEGMRLAIQTSRQAASLALSEGAIVEAVEIAGADATSALVAEMGHGFDMNARALRNLGNRGVPDRVLDMMIAMTWPEHFHIDVDGGVDRAVIDPVASERVAYGPAAYGSSRFYCTGWFGRCTSMDLRFGYRYGGYGYGFPYYSYGYSPYGGGGWYGWYRGPRYIVIGPGTGGPSERGRMTPDGYRPPSSSSATGSRQVAPRSGATAAPSRPAATSGRGSPAAARTPTPSTRSSPPSSSSTDRRPAQRRGGGGDELPLLF